MGSETTRFERVFGRMGIEIFVKGKRNEEVVE